MSQDTTGLCTVREWAEEIASTAASINEACGHDRHKPCAELTFEHNGKRYTIEGIVTRTEPCQ